MCSKKPFCPHFSLPRRLTAAKFVVVVVCVACYGVPWYSPVACGMDREGAPGSRGWWSWPDGWRKFHSAESATATFAGSARDIFLEIERDIFDQLTCFVHSRQHARTRILQSGRTRINLFIIWGAPSRIVLCGLLSRPVAARVFSHLRFNKRRGTSARIAAYFRKLYASHAFVSFLNCNLSSWWITFDSHYVNETCIHIL